MIIENTTKDFENPETGTYLGTVIDVVNLGKIRTEFKGKVSEKVKIRLVWVLDKNDSEGNPFRIVRRVNATMDERGQLYELVKGILGTAPPVPFDDETLIGRSNQIVVVKEANPVTGKIYSNPKVFLPVPAGAIPPQAPQGFVRECNKNKGTVTSAAAQATQQAQANPVPQAQSVVQSAVAPAVAVDAAF
jgi:hypothetical protein